MKDMKAFPLSRQFQSDAAGFSKSGHKGKVLTQRSQFARGQIGNVGIKVGLDRGKGERKGGGTSGKDEEVEGTRR